MKDAKFLKFQGLFKKKIRRPLIMAVVGILGALLGVWIFSFILAGDIYEYQDSVDGVNLPQVDVIVVLAGGRGRISAAGDVWYRYRETAEAPIKPILFISGMGHQSNWAVLSRQIRRGVFSELKPENVVLETESGNTDANAQYFARYAKDRGWTRILLMTSPYHMKRARYVFERRLPGIHIETQSVYQDPFESGEWRFSVHGIRVTMDEYWKWIYYKLFWSP
ncbi:YdcF family protein [Bdellovibrionota bacterium FG-2]